MQEVEIIYTTIEQKREYESLIESVIQTCMKEEKLNCLGYYICVTLTNPNEIRKLNNTYRNMNKETDVLSFPMFEKDEVDLIRKNKKKNNVAEPLGDIIISIPKVKEQAIEYGHSFERELSYMVVHGFYHIIGYDHIKEEDKKIMRKKEEIILSLLNQKRDES